MAKINVKFSETRRKFGDLLCRVGDLFDEDQPMNISCLEVHSPEKTGAEDSLYFSDLTVLLMFSITKEEASWMDSDPGKLNDLIQELMEKLPNDRLMAGNYLGLADNNTMAFQPTGKCETMDHFKIKFAFLGLPYSLMDWQKVEKVWIMMNARLPQTLPAIDLNGVVNVFTDEETAQKDIQNFMPDFKLSVMTGEQWAKVVQLLPQLGIQKMAVRNEKGNRVLELSQIIDGETAYYAADFQALVIRFLQTARSTHAKEANYQKTSLVFWNQVLRLLLDTKFIVPVIFEGEKMEDRVEDDVLHVFPGAISEDIFVEENGIRLDGKMIAGSAGLTLTLNPSIQKMHMRTTYNGATKEEWLAIFTDVHEFNRLWKGKAHVGLVTLADFAKNYAPAKGVVINPTTTCLFIDDQTITQLDAIRGKA